MAAGPPLHVLLLTPGFPACEGDTVCVPALQLFVREAMRRGDARFTVVPLHYPASRRPYPWHGTVVRPAGGDNRGGPRRPRTWLRAAVAAASVHGRDPADLVHGAWLTDAAALALKLGPLLRRPTVLTVMGQDAEGATPWTGALPLDRATVVAPCRRAAERLRATCGRDADRVIPWGVEAPAAEPATWAARDVDVLGVGALEAVKDWPLFLRVVARLVDEGRCRRAVLLGEGGERGRLESYAAELGLGGRLELPGLRPRVEVLGWMARSRVLLHTAWSEGLGLAMLEALAEGATVVSRPVGIAEASERWLLADDEVGLVVATATALAAPRDTSSRRPWPVEGTARSYGALYRDLVWPEGRP